MRVFNKLAQLKEIKSGVKHCTFNPDGPGVVRIHLVPPKFRLFGNSDYIVILNGYYLLPLGYSWALMLSEFMAEVNKFDSKPISDEDYEAIVMRVVGKIHKVFPMASKAEMREDLSDLLDIIFIESIQN